MSDVDPIVLRLAKLINKTFHKKVWLLPKH
jgi:hypothetical protein